MPTINVNRIPEHRCPICGERRPTDWFGSELKKTSVDEKTMLTKKTVRWRKYLGCWRCRELGRNTDLTPIPKIR